MVASDIPLKSLARYTPLEDDSTGRSMLGARASSSPGRGSIFKRGSRYTEIPDDQERLLVNSPAGEGYGDDDSDTLVSSREAVRESNRRKVWNVVFLLFISSIH